MHKFKNKRLLLASFGLLSFSTIVGSVALSSCTSSSTTPYAPYTAIKMNITSGGNTTTSTYRYQTSNKTISYYNTDDSLFGSSNQNKYLTLSNIKDYYYGQNKTLVQNILTDANWSTLKSLYGESSSTVELSSYKTRPDFFYGAAPTSSIINIAKIYNQMSISSSIFQYLGSLSNTLLSYLVADSIGSLFNNDIKDLIGLNSQLGDNQIAKELLAGNAFTFGIGGNIYQLWPTGIEADINFPDELNSSNANVNNTLMTASNTKTNDINAPYNIANYNSSNSQTNLPKITANKVIVSNIKITYQWYQTSRVGGSYIDSFTSVNNATTSDQKAVLKKMGIESGNVNSLAYSLPISNMTFDIIPETYSYQDPFYSGFYDTVFTGLWNVKTPLTLKTNNTIDFTELYPSAMATSISDSQNVRWRGIITTSSINSLKNYLPESVYKDVSSKKLSNLPYYQNNLSYTNDINVLPYASSDSNVMLNQYNLNQLLNLFSDPFNKLSSTIYYNQPVYNNVNNLTKQNYLNIWTLGYLIANNSTNIDIKNDSEYKNIKSQLNFSSNDSNISSSLMNNQYYTSGKSAFFNLIKLGSTISSKGYQFSSNSITTTNFLTFFNKKEN